MIDDVCNNLPCETKKVVTSGLGSFIRLLILNRISDKNEYPELSISQSLNIAEEVLLIRLILYSIEPNLTIEMDKLTFFCEFLSLILNSPDSVLQHAKTSRKFTMYEYSILLKVAHRNTGLTEENKEYFAKQEQELFGLFKIK